MRLVLSGANQENIMAIEHACIRVVRKPWGSTDLRSWSEIRHTGVAIGELRFQRPGINAPGPALLLKLLFTKEPLSIKVHPHDAFAQSIGLGHGQTEAWYILSATPGAKIAVGLKRQLTPPQLRTSLEDGSISDLVQWHRILKDDVIFLPAGTLRAIGPGLVVAEIQQSGEGTFGLFDHGGQREIHVDNAVAAANAGPAECQTVPRRLTDVRTLLVASQHFVLERIDLAPKSNWELRAEHETWVFVLEGHARVRLRTVFVGGAIFLEADRTSIRVGSSGLKGLVAYSGTEPSPSLLYDLDGQNAGFPIRHFSQLPLPNRATTGSPARSTETRQ
jgi:mannose-6-phosphate isomerase